MTAVAAPAPAPSRPAIAQHDGEHHRDQHQHRQQDQTAGARHRRAAATSPGIGSQDPAGGKRRPGTIASHGGQDSAGPPPAASLEILGATADYSAVIAISTTVIPAKAGTHSSG